jgi:hypothetical protein
MATASRIQDRRAEQALQIAQGEIDRVRSIVERGTYTNDDLPTAVDIPGGEFRDVAPPSPSNVSSQLKSPDPTCNTYDGRPVSRDTLLQVDVTGRDADGSCKSDFLVQTFRTRGPGETATPAKTTAFRMGVRVYVDTALLRNSGSLATPVEQASLTFTTGLGGQTRKPLSVLSSTIVRNDQSTSLQDYKDLCESPSGC